MRVHVLQHIPFEDIGSMAGWLAVRQAEVTWTRLFVDAALPRLEGLDLIIAMGGPMSANDEQTLAWLRPEKAFIRDAVNRGIPVLGVCLGAQLMASALGARVYPGRQKEIGWFQIEAVPHGEESLGFPGRCTVFHWHGETFDLPAGAVRLARSRVCENQAFQIGRSALGLQFHLETTPDSALALIENCRHELVPGPTVQSESELRQVPPAAYAEINGLMDRMLSYLLRTQ